MNSCDLAGLIDRHRRISTDRNAALFRAPSPELEDESASTCGGHAQAETRYVRVPSDLAFVGAFDEGFGQSLIASTGHVDLLAPELRRAFRGSNMEANEAGLDRSL